MCLGWWTPIVSPKLFISRCAERIFREILRKALWQDMKELCEMRIKSIMVTKKIIRNLLKSAPNITYVLTLIKTHIWGLFILLPSTNFCISKNPDCWAAMNRSREDTPPPRLLLLQSDPWLNCRMKQKDASFVASKISRPAWH